MSNATKPSPFREKVISASFPSEKKITCDEIAAELTLSFFANNIHAVAEVENERIRIYKTGANDALFNSIYDLSVVFSKKNGKVRQITEYKTPKLRRDISTKNRSGILSKIENFNFFEIVKTYYILLIPSIFTLLSVIAFVSSFFWLIKLLITTKLSEYTIDMLYIAGAVAILGIIAAILLTKTINLAKERIGNNLDGWKQSMESRAEREFNKVYNSYISTLIDKRRIALTDWKKAYFDYSNIPDVKEICEQFKKDIEKSFVSAIESIADKHGVTISCSAIEYSKSEIIENISRMYPEFKS